MSRQPPLRDPGAQAERTLLACTRTSVAPDRRCRPAPAIDRIQQLLALVTVLPLLLASVELYVAARLLTAVMPVSVAVPVAGALTASF